MSKLYEQYLKLKYQDTKKLYLFRSGLFYIALEDNALTLSKKFNFKLTNLGNTTLKCGFPESRLKYYIEHFKLQNIDYVLIEPKNNTTIDKGVSNNNLILKNNKRMLKIISKLATLDINNTTLKEGFDILYSFHVEAQKIIDNKEDEQ